MRYGLIGEKLGHSFSKEIHEQLADYEYQLCPLSREEFPDFMAKADFAAINVTIPYKEMVIPYLSEIDERAAGIGAVNTIVNRGGKLYGYNTDFDGVCYMLRKHNIDLAGRNVLILGTGGTSKTARFVAKTLGAATVQIVSRSAKDGLITYEQAAEQKQTQVIINTTPRGMYPQNQEQPLLDLAQFPALEAVVDVIYNPLQTNLVLQAKKLGINACGGLEMLVAQAKYAAERFCDKQIDDSEIDRIYSDIRRQKLNIAIIGMPGSGKTTVGAKVAELLGRKLVDCDKELVERAGTEIQTIFQEKGEPYFRTLETEVLAEIAKESSRVIATGGGVIKNPLNIDLLRQNSLIVFLDKAPEMLSISDERPLSPDQNANLALYSERYKFYCMYADLHIKNDNTAEEAADEIAALWQNI
jgi:shikimate dehydrogenase